MIAKWGSVQPGLSHTPTSYCNIYTKSKIQVYSIKYIKDFFYLLAAALLAEWGIAIGRSELELLIDLNHPGRLLREPALSPPGGPTKQFLCVTRKPPGKGRELHFQRNLPSGYIHCKLCGVWPQSSQIPGIFKSLRDIAASESSLSWEGFEGNRMFYN